MRSKPPANPNAFKHLFGAAHLRRLADAIYAVHPKFNRRRFQSLSKKLELLEMKARVHLIRDTLRSGLPDHYPTALTILLESVKAGSLKGFDLWPYTEYIQTEGLNTPTLSLEALKKLTILFTAEWAIRPFIRQNQKTTLAYLKRCAGDKNHHVRRWASEGSRPRLPWGEKLHEFITDPILTLPIIEKLRHDPELYVRKSVANHLNDISKDHPDLVLKILKEWKQKSTQEHSEKINWITKHSLRTLIKAGHPAALKLIGATTKPKIRLTECAINKNSYTIGEKIEISLGLTSLANKAQKLIIDYLIHFLKANKRHSSKTFKLRTLTLQAKQTLILNHSHHLRGVTTRKHYSGKHLLEIQINGTISKQIKWDLE